MSKRHVGFYEEFHPESFHVIPMQVQSQLYHCKDHMAFFDLGQLVKRIRKPLRQQTATTRQGHTDDLVKFNHRRIQLDLPKGTHVVVLREGGNYIFYAGD